MPVRFTLILVFACAALPAWGQNVVRDDFEGPETALRETGGDASYKIEAHRRVTQGAHSGRACEHLRISGNNGTSVYFSRSIGAARVIHELAASVWLKSDRAGLQILARVVLPRTTDPQTGKPLTTLLRGSDYQQVGVWQQLRVDNLPRLLERQVRVLRTQFGPRVDPREAYVDLILLNVYGGPGVTNAWIDDLEVTGVVSSDAAGATPETSLATGPSLPGDARPIAWPGGQGVPGVEMRGRLLLVGGKPFFPRAIEYRGEPLSRLQALGFNTVWLAREPGPALLREATGLGLWLVAPPPPARELELRSGAPASLIDGSFDPVLAWDLGSGLAKRELEATRRWAELVKAADPRHRPLVCEAESDLYGYTRLVDLLLARREPLGSTLPLDQYALWLRDRSRLARGGTPLWVAIQTEPAPRLLEQIGLLASAPQGAVTLEEPQIRALVHAALAARARGLCFTSNGRLDAGDAATARRAAVLELINLHLALLERWPAAGSFAPTASSNDPHTTGAVIETDRSRLLLPIFSPPHGQMVMGNPSPKDLSFVVPGVPEGNNAYELSPTSLRPLASKRIAGGTRVTLGESERDSVVVFTQDERVLRVLSDRLAQSRARATQLTVDLAHAQLSDTQAGLERLAAAGQAISAVQKPLASAQDALRECETLRKTELVQAYYRARRAQQVLRDIRRAHWDQAVPKTEWPLVDPFVANFAVLSEHPRFAHQLAAAPRGPDRLPEGGFESLEAMRQAGWKYYQHAQPNIITTVDLDPQAAHGGRVGLRLRVTPADPNNVPGAIETPPLWITSPGVHVQPGELLEMKGWVRIAAPIVGGVDGLLVIDTLSGEALAGRVTTAGEWREFTIYRAAVRSTPVVITFALGGIGEAWIDDVSIRVVARGGQPQQAQITASPPNRPAQAD